MWLLLPHAAYLRAHRSMLDVGARPPGMRWRWMTIYNRIGKDPHLGWSYNSG